MPENKPPEQKDIQATAQVETAKEPYTSPKFFAHGDLRDLTLAPSPGIIESGGPSGWRD